MMRTVKRSLSPEMQRCLDFVKRHDGQIHRHPRGFWAAKDWQRGTGESFSAQTVEALVTRGLLVYSEWMVGRIPVEAVLECQERKVA